MKRKIQACLLHAILTSLPLGGLGWALTSCNDYLEIYPENVQPTDEYWGSKEEVDATLSAGYYYLRDAVETYLIPWGELRAGCVSARGSNVLQRFEIKPTEKTLNKWAPMYKIINAANLELKNAEKGGLSYLLLEVLKLRPLVQRHFADTLRWCKRELQERVEATSARSGEQARLIETVSLFLAMCRLLEERAPHLPLPFSYETFLGLAAEKVRRQIEMLVQTDKLATFFATMDYLIDQGRIVEGWDFKIEAPRRITLKGQPERPLDGERVIYLSLPNIHKMYAATSSGGERPLTMQTLQVNLRSHASFLGMVASTRFRWTETVERPLRAETTDLATGAIVPANPVVQRVKESKEKNTSAYALNYDVLRQLTGVDFERKPGGETEPMSGPQSVGEPTGPVATATGDRDLPWPMD